MKISTIVAIARNGAIGRGGDQPFYIREDLRRFKALTTSHTIIMGRKTFEALPKGALPNRRNIVVTRQEGYIAPGAETANTLDKALEMAREGCIPGNNGEQTPESEAFVIGGGEIYRQAAYRSNCIYATEIDANVPDADTFFPMDLCSEDMWTEGDASEWKVDPDSGVRYRFVCYLHK